MSVWEDGWLCVGGAATFNINVSAIKDEPSLFCQAKKKEVRGHYVHPKSHLKRLLSKPVFAPGSGDNQ